MQYFYLPCYKRKNIQLQNTIERKDDQRQKETT